MKKFLFTYFFGAALILSCASQKNGTSVSYSSDNKGGKEQHTISIKDENGYLDLQYAGEIMFNDEETSIKKMSPDGFIRYKSNGEKFEAQATDNGHVEYEINGGNKTIALSNEEAVLVAKAIKTMIAYGIGAGDRVERMYKKGGSEAVLNEVKNLKGDFVKSIYLEYLLNTSSLSTDELTTIASQVKTLITSDFEKGKLLGKFSGKYLANDATATAYLEAVKSINSDFEKANAVKAILKQPLTPTQFTQVLQLSKSIQSDFEKSNVVKEVLKSNTLAPNQFSEVLQTTATISSDFEKAGVLQSILNNNQLPAAQFNETLAVIGNINSDFEKGNVLKKVVDSDIKSEDQWISLLNSTEKLSSDFEKGNVFVAIANKMPQTENMKTAYMKSAKTISSDFEYAKAVKAVK